MSPKDYKKIFLKYHANAWFLSMCLPPGDGVLSYLYINNCHKSGENVGKNI